MLEGKTLVFVGAILALAYSSVVNPRNTAQTPVVLPPHEACEGSVPETVTPTIRMDAKLNQGEPPSEIKAEVQCMMGTSDPPVYYTKITITSNIYNVSMEPPNDPEAPLPDDDNLEHVKVYFANTDHRILEIKINRFWQQSIRLLSKPYNELRHKPLPKLIWDFPVVSGSTWTAECLFDSELLPRNVTNINVVDVDPTKEGANRYLMNYRIYNHPISIYDTQVAGKYKEITPVNIVDPQVNTNYSQYWSGLNEP